MDLEASAASGAAAESLLMLLHAAEVADLLLLLSYATAAAEILGFVPVVAAVVLPHADGMGRVYPVPAPSDRPVAAWILLLVL